MDWSNIQQMQTLFDELEALEDDSHSHAPFSTAERPIDRTDEQTRTLVGYLTICREKQDDITYLSHLEHLLSHVKLKDKARQVVLEEIQSVEADLLDQHTRSLTQFADKKAPEVAPTLPAQSPNTPHIQITEHAEVGFEGCFAYRLTHSRAMLISGEEIPVEASSLTFLSTLAQTLRMWQDRLSLSLDAEFTWRYHGISGRLVFDLIVRIVGPEAGIVRTAAQGFADLFAYHLPLSDIYRFQPITEQETLAKILHPLPLRSVARLQKREQTLSNSGQRLYWVHPLGGSVYMLRDMLHHLAQSEGEALVEVNIRLTQLTADEIDAIRDLITAGNHADQDDMAFVRQQSLGSPPNKQREIAERYRRFIEQTQPDAYEVDISVGSTINPDIMPLALLAGRALMGVGAFDVLPAPYDANPETYVSLAAIPTRTNAPIRLHRLPRLYTLNEAALVSRMPRPHRGGLPGVPPLTLRSFALPPHLPVTGVMLGVSVETSVPRTTIRLPYADRMRHVYLVGRTGTGKTTLLQNMLLQDIEAGHGTAVIDPHGDLTDAILERIPPERADDVVVFDPADVERPIGLNLLDVEGLIEQNMAVSDFIGLMYSMYDPHRTGIVGPRFEQSVRGAMQTAMLVRGATIIDVLRIIADDKYRKEFQQHSQDVVMENYWKKIVDRQSDFHRSEVLDYITSKFSRFVNDPMVRQIIGQPRTALNLREITDEGKILLVNLSKGRLGEHNSHFIGFTLVSQLMVNFFQRAQMPVQQRKPFYLYIDEFQNFATPSLATMLSEGRKYGVGLVLANQFTYQLPENVREAISGNVGTICAFQVGLRDADYIAREMYPVFSVNDMVNLPAYHVAIKMLNEGKTLMPFVLKTFAEHRAPIHGMREAILRYSRYRYGRSAGRVADEFRHQFERSLDDRLVGPKTLI